MFIGERYGRRLVLVLMQLLCLAGVAVTYTSTTFGQILAGRCLVQAYIGMQEWLVPMLQAELVPASIRGSMVALFVFEHQFAAFICSIITNFTSKHTDNSAWRIPVVIMFAWPSLVLLLQWVVPESPRWLLRQDRFDDAGASLHHLYGCSQDYSAAEEAQLLKESLDEVDQVSKGEWRDLWKGTNRVSLLLRPLSMKSKAFS
jgi:MFS family permease